MYMHVVSYGTGSMVLHHMDVTLRFIWWVCSKQQGRRLGFFWFRLSLSSGCWQSQDFVLFLHMRRHGQPWSFWIAFSCITYLTRVCVCVWKLGNPPSATWELSACSGSWINFWFHSVSYSLCAGLLALVLCILLSLCNCVLWTKCWNTKW